MAFSKGKRIEDETSKRIIDLAVNIGCKEGPDALTVTRICRELNCDRRVIYNRFRDVDEINMIVAQRCNAELIANARAAEDSSADFYTNLINMIDVAFIYIYEKNPFFQYYTAMYKITDDGIENDVLSDLTEFIRAGKKTGEVNAQIDSVEMAKNVWLITIGISTMLATNSNYRYQDAKATMMYGINALIEYMK